MPLNLQPHRQFLDPRTGLPVTEHVADYVRFARAQERHLPNGKVIYENPEMYYVQGGKIMDAGGGEVDADQAPSWLWEELRRLTASARRAVSLELPEDKIHSIDELPQEFRTLYHALPNHLKVQLFAEKASTIDEKAPETLSETSSTSFLEQPMRNDPGGSQPRTYTCEDCQEEMPLSRKGVHRARHAKAAKRARRNYNNG